MPPPRGFLSLEPSLTAVVTNQVSAKSPSVPGRIVACDEKPRCGADCVRCRDRGVSVPPEVASRFTRPVHGPCSAVAADVERAFRKTGSLTHRALARPLTALARRRLGCRRFERGRFARVLSRAVTFRADPVAETRRTERHERPRKSGSLAEYHDPNRTEDPFQPPAFRMETP